MYCVSCAYFHFIFTMLFYITYPDFHIIFEANRIALNGTKRNKMGLNRETRTKPNLTINSLFGNIAWHFFRLEKERTKERMDGSMSNLSMLLLCSCAYWFSWSNIISMEKSSYIQSNIMMMSLNFHAILTLCFCLFAFQFISISYFFLKSIMIFWSVFNMLRIQKENDNNNKNWNWDEQTQCTLHHG